MKNEKLILKVLQFSGPLSERQIINMKTKVIFRKFPEGDVIALFPDEIADLHGNIMSYQRIGQHGAASPALINELRPAKPKDFRALKLELESLGYLLRRIK